jgi:hypothetical protein
MATKKAIKEFVEVEEELFVSDLTEAEVLDAKTLTQTINAKVKGTWTQYWGTEQFSFVDGQRYKLPRDLFNYLKNSGNIYDTL